MKRLEIVIPTEAVPSCVNLQTESEFESAVVELAHLRGWRCAGFRPARVTRQGRETWETPVKYDGKGWVDLVLVRPSSTAAKGRILFIELKSEQGTLSQEQKEWARAIIDAGGEWYCWKPSKWQELEATLK